jgi:predicted aspartyl protease
LELVSESLKVLGEETFMRTLISDYEGEMLIDSRVLEQLGLEVDLTIGRLRETKIYPLFRDIR